MIYIYIYMNRISHIIYIIVIKPIIFYIIISFYIYNMNINTFIYTYTCIIMVLYNHIYILIFITGCIPIICGNISREVLLLFSLAINRSCHHAQPKVHTLRAKLFYPATLLCSGQVQACQLQIWVCKLGHEALVTGRVFEASR